MSLNSSNIFRYIINNCLSMQWKSFHIEDDIVFILKTINYKQYVRCANVCSTKFDQFMLAKKKKSKEKKKSVISSKTNKIQIAFISNCLRNTWGRPIQFHLTLPSFIFIFIFILIFCHLLFKQSNKSEFNLAKGTMYTTIFNYMIIQRVFGVLRSLFDRPKCCVFEHGWHFTRLANLTLLPGLLVYQRAEETVVRYWRL